MENSTSISDDLTATFLQVEQIQGVEDDINIASAQSMIEAIGARFSQGEGLEHIETFLSIKSSLAGKIGPSVTDPEPTSPSQSTSSLEDENPSKLPGELILGTCNQFNDGAHPAGTFSNQYRVACSSTSVAFVSYFLNHGTTNLNPGKVDQIIQKGQDNFLSLVQERAKNLEEMLAAFVSEDDTVKGSVKTQLLQAAQASQGKQLHGMVEAYDTPYEFDLQAKNSTMTVTLRYGREVLKMWEGTDLSTISEEFAKEMLNKSRQLIKDGNDLFKGNMMTPVDTLTKYQDFVGKTPRAPEAFFLAPQEETRKDQISHLIQETLLPLAEENPQGRVAGAITINGEILGIGLEKKENQITITLFDSHGKTQLHGQSEGYVYITKSIDAAATTLLAMMPIESTEIEVGELSEEEYAMIFADQEKKNEVSLWLAVSKEEPTPFLEEIPSPEPKITGSCIIS